MKRYALIIFALAIVIILISVGKGSMSKKDVVWTTDFDQAMMDAKDANKLVMIEFGATWCKPCKVYESDVFGTPQFRDKAKDMILVNVDVDQHPELAKLFQVQGLPNVYIVNGQQQLVGHVMGYRGAKVLFDEIDRAKALR